MKKKLSIIITALSIFFTITVVNLYAQDSPQWHLPEGAKARIGKGGVNLVRYSPDGTMLAVATTIGVWIYDVQTSKELQLLAIEPIYVLNMAFSPDSTKLVSAGLNTPLSLWDVESGRQLRTFPIESSWSNKGIAFSPDGKIIASNGQIGTVLLWNSDTGENIRTLEGQDDWEGGNSIQFSPDGKTLATGWEDNNIRLWDVNTGTIRHTLSEHEESVFTLAFTPDGKTLVSGSRDKTVRLWDVQTGNLNKTLTGHPVPVIEVAVSPHGNVLISCDDFDEIRLWNLDTGDLIERFLDYWHSPRTVSFSPDGTAFATAGYDDKIYIWDVAAFMKTRLLTTHIIKSPHIVFSPTENTIALGGRNGSVRLLDADTGTIKDEFIGHTVSVSSLAYSPYGIVLASGSYDDTIRLWNTETGIARNPPIETPGNPRNIVFSPNGNLVACITSNNQTNDIRIYRVVDGHQVHNMTAAISALSTNNHDTVHRNTVNEIAFSPDGKTIVSCGYDNTIRFWDVEQGTHLRKIDTDQKAIYDMAISPNGQTLTGMSRTSINQWNVETGKKLQTRQAPDNFGWLMSMALSPDGTMAATCGNSSRILLWDMTNFTQIRVFEGHSYWISHVVFSSDGRTLASYSNDGTILLWDIAPVLPSPTVVKLSPAKVQSPAIGEHLTLSLDIAEGQDIAGYQATVHFDNTALSYIDSSIGDYLVGGDSLVGGVSNPDLVAGDSLLGGVSNPDSASITLYATTYGEQSNGDGTLATITFEVIAQKTSAVSLSDVLLTDSLGGSTVPQTFGAEILESHIQPEDVNGDGVVNISDLTFVAANLGNRGANPADVNGDGEVNIVDLALVAAAIGENADIAAAPSTLFDLPSRATVEKWFRDARSLNLSDPQFQRGILFLENLLKSLTPKQTALLPNYPNPFNPETWIPYQLASPTDVNISIYASDGKLVRTFTIGNKPVGKHQVHWDGNNAYGEKVASGIYFYTLTAGNYTTTRKMSIQK